MTVPRAFKTHDAETGLAYELPDGLPGLDVLEVAHARGRGLTWPQVAKECGMHVDRIHAMRRNHPVDQLAVKFARENAAAGMMALHAAFGDAAQLLVDTIRGDVNEPELDDGKPKVEVSLDQRIDAAKELIKQVIKATEIANRPQAATVSRAETMTAAELESAAREATTASEGAR